MMIKNIIVKSISILVLCVMLYPFNSCFASDVVKTVIENQTKEVVIIVEGYDIKNDGIKKTSSTKVFALDGYTAEIGCGQWVPSINKNIGFNCKLHPVLNNDMVQIKLDTSVSYIKGL